MADILTIISAFAPAFSRDVTVTLICAPITFWKLKGWNKKMDELYENMKKWAVDE